MNRLQFLKSALVGGASVLTLAGPSSAKVFNVPDGDLAAALGAYMQQAGVQIVYSDDAVRGRKSHGAKGNYSETAALTQILRGTGFTAQATSSSVIGIIPEKQRSEAIGPEEIEVAQAARRAPMAAPTAKQSVETVVVTAQKKSESIQQVPIAVTALSQAQLTERQVAGGPDLVKEVPNLTFSKTNFTGYNIEIRGIGTQAISVTTDPAVAVAFNGTPFIRNHFFEQEFYDVQDVEVLRGPQGTLFGRNATAGVVNVKSALPDDTYEAMLSADLGNYSNRRLEGMLNIPIAGDKLDLRIAGEWTKRNGYTFDTSLDQSVDGRDLWSGRVTLGWKPTQQIQTDLVWEHFSEDDDRVRSAKQLCKKDPGLTNVDSLDVPSLPNPVGTSYQPGFTAEFAQTWLSQGCLPTSLYSSSAYETPNGQTLPFVALGEFFISTGGNATQGVLNPIDPYASQTQSPNLRVIQSLIKPAYRAKNDTLEFNIDYDVTPTLTLTSQTGYNNDFLYSTEDFNRFDTAPGLFSNGFDNAGIQQYGGYVNPAPNGVYCDPQLGCSSSMVAEDVSQERASQFSQEVRLTSHFDGPLNFSFGSNYMHYETDEDYYVMFNLISAEEQLLNASGPGQYTLCHTGYNEVLGFQETPYEIAPIPFTTNPGIEGLINHQSGVSSVFGCGVTGVHDGTYIDPNPLGQINGQGHNYFRSENPYDLSSYAGFVEAYYDVTPDLKLTGGLRWTDDQKTFYDIPSWTYLLGGGYPVEGIVRQGWNEWTGRFVANWTPNLDFTDQTLIYASYAHGYKGGGANPPTPEVDFENSQSSVTHPPTFAPEHIEAFELGTKNTALDGALTLNGDVFFYNYHGYQISQIVDRTSINLNFNATVKGAELESTWEPLPGLKFNLAGGWEDSAVDKNQRAIDLMDRTAGVPGWVVVRPFVDETSNCILPANVVRQILITDDAPSLFGAGIAGACDAAYDSNTPGIFVNYSEDQGVFSSLGFNPATAPNNGEGFYKNLSGNKLPSAPPFTLSAGGQYSMPVSSDWAATLRADFYWQGNQYARIFNDKPYDSIHGYTNLNLALILDSQNGWQVMAYVKNVFDVTAITGDFLNSDDTSLTTNVFVTDPRLFGVRVTKQLDDGDGFWGSEWSGADFIKDIFSDADGGKPPLWIELGSQFDTLAEDQDAFLPPFLLTTSRPSFAVASPAEFEKASAQSRDLSAKISFEPSRSDWVFSVGILYGRNTRQANHTQVTAQPTPASRLKYDAYQTFTVGNSESHTILDFQAGKDVGLGELFGGTDSLLSAGVRFVQFNSRTSIAIESLPTNAGVYSAYKHFGADFAAKRKFSGIGPSLSWKSSMSLLGDSNNIALDWGLNGAVLFGRQGAHGHHDTSQIHGSVLLTYHHSQSFDRSREVVVPNLGGFAGISWRYSNAKVSFGYRADEFFGAMDGGIDTYKSENRGFFGPYANVSIGIGG